MRKLLSRGAALLLACGAACLGMLVPAAFAQDPAPAREEPAAAFTTVSAPGIYPVYEREGRWLLIDRRAGGSLKRGQGLAVIGSKGADLFHAARATSTSEAACRGHRPVPVPAFWVSAKGKEPFARVGSPIIAIALKEGASIDPSRAAFKALANEAREETYRLLEVSIRQALGREMESGERPPAAEPPRLKIDFGARLAAAGIAEPFLLVEGSEIGSNYRRCLRLFDGTRAVGGCAEMPHALRAETRGLSFVAYDPSGKGRPFVLAYTASEPLWGHERWGFTIGPQGPKLFLQDALDPKCREGF